MNSGLVPALRREAGVGPAGSSSGESSAWARTAPAALADDEDLEIRPTPLKTYIVEDSPVIRENLIATLEELVPAEIVGTADNEAAAVAWLQQPHNGCDLVIVDIFLKSGSGLGVLAATLQLGERAKLVVLSNYATPDMRRKCIELGADKVFDKSNEIDALISYCQRLAAGEATGFSPL